MVGSGRLDVKWIVVGLAVCILLLYMFTKKVSTENVSCPLNMQIKEGSEPWNRNISEDGHDPILIEPVEYREPIMSSTNYQKIPRIIHQTFSPKIITLERRKAMESVLSNNGDYEYYYYNDVHRREFISKNFSPEILSCYDSLIPGAYRADLFRYCVLMVKGGVYLDSGFICVTPLRKIIEPSDTFVSAIDLATDINVQEGYKLCNGFIACTPNHPIIKLAIEICCERIANREYGDSNLYPTGPLVLGLAFVNIVDSPPREGDYENGIRLLKKVTPFKCLSSIIYSGGFGAFYTKYPGAWKDAKFQTGKPVYGVMWKNREIYR